MHLFRLTVVFGFVITPLAALAETASAPPPKARGVSESVHVAPQSNASALKSAEETAVRKCITAFNSTQESLDASFDKN